MKKIVMMTVLGMAAAVSRADLIVDYEPPGSGGTSAPDTQTTTGATWDFSDSTPMVTATSGQNGTVYGGVITTWSVAATYTPNFRHISTALQSQTNPDNGSDTSEKGMWIWNKSDFLNGADSAQIGFTSGDEMRGGAYNLSLDDSNEIRFVIKEGGVYYVSSWAKTNDNVGFAIDPSASYTDWAVISTVDYTMGTFTPKTFTDVEAVGIYYDISTAEGQSLVNFGDFKVNATVVPETNTVGLFILSGGFTILVRRIRRK